jgi:hypothetical protein
VHAQYSGSITGVIADSASQKKLALATVTVFKAKDTSIVTYRLSDPSGVFKITGLPFNIPLRLMVTFSGYNAYRRVFTLTPQQNQLQAGTITLAATSHELEEMIVTAERPPVSVKKDTIEFNATAFKTLPNALVEDLLKKLPGVQVDPNGDIYVNGQRVNRILVDGKRFFGDDPKMATRNLPANVIDKVQVVDDKDQIAQNNDGDMSNIGKVINMTLKKGVKKGWFGKLYGGGGSDSRYEAGGIANIYRDTLQLSVLAFSNNINRSGFSMKDVADLGGFSRSGFNSIMITNGNGRNGFALNGISFGGTDDGLSRTTGAGFNLNHAPSKNLSFFGQYFYGNTHTELQQVSNRQQFIDDTLLTTRTVSNALNTAFSHTVNAGSNWRPDSLTNITFSAGYVYTQNNNDAPSSIQTTSNKTGVLSTGQGILNMHGSNSSYNHSLYLTRRFAGKRKRSLSVYHGFNYTNNPVSTITESLNNFVYPVDSAAVFRQLRMNTAPSTNAQVNGVYSDQLSKKITLRLNTRYEYNRQGQEVLTYGQQHNNGKYDSLNETLSSSLTRLQHRWLSGVTMGYTLNKVTVNIGAGWLQQWLDNRFSRLGDGSNRYYSNILVNSSINWKRFNLSYSQDVVAPAISYLIPVPDNTNPFYIRNGNAALLPAKRNTFSFNGNIYNQRSGLNFYIYSNLSFSDNGVIQRLDVDDKGIQTATPVNADGVMTGYASFRVNKQFKNKQRFIFTIDGGLWSNINSTPVLYNGVRSASRGFSAGPSLGLRFNWQDLVELAPQYSIEVNKTSYSSKAFSNTDIITQNLQGELVVRLPKKFVWETNAMYRYNSEVAPGLPKSNLYWNAALTLLLLKEDKGQLRFAVYDILNRNNSLRRFINANSINDIQTNVLQRYFMLTFTYNIRTMGAAKKIGGKDKLFLF